MSLEPPSPDASTTARAPRASPTIAHERRRRRGHRGIPRRARRYARTRQAPRRVRHGEHHHRARGYGSLTFSLDSLITFITPLVTRTRKKTASTIRPSPQPSVSVVRALRRHPRHPYVRTSTRSKPGAASYAKTNHDARRNRSCYAYSDVPGTRDGLTTPRASSPSPSVECIRVPPQLPLQRAVPPTARHRHRRTLAVLTESSQSITCKQKRCQTNCPYGNKKKLK